MLPKDIQSALQDLTKHYGNLEENRRGANGYLFFATNLVSKQEVAIKFYAGGTGEQRHDEPRQLAAINSPNVLPILDARIVSDDWGYFATPRCMEGDLDDYISTRPSVCAAIDTMLGICRGISVIHAARLLHRDIKPANIVIDGGKPRIADFGSVIAIPEGQHDVHASRHSILYRPPESFTTDRYSIKGDIYQLGILTYQLLGGELSYNGENYFSNSEVRKYALIQDQVDRSVFIDMIIRQKVETGKLLRFETLPLWVTPSAVRLIKSMVAVNPAKRPITIAETAATLTRIRANISDWQWNNDYPQIISGSRIIQIRPNKGGFCEAFHDCGSGFRKIPKIPKGSLQELVRIFR